MTFSYGEQALFQWISATPIIVDVFFTIRFEIFHFIFFLLQKCIAEIHIDSIALSVVSYFHTISCVIKPNWKRSEAIR